MVSLPSPGLSNKKVPGTDAVIRSTAFWLTVSKSTPPGPFTQTNMPPSGADQVIRCCKEPGHRQG